MSYITLITNAGLSKITAALAGGTQITMGQIAIGDGNGSATTPGQTQSSLINEVYRATANQIAMNSEGKLVAELIVPQSVGGFTVREIALFDSTGDLFAVGSTPAIQKPTVAENAAAELVIRLIVAISNTAVIQLTAASAIVATRDWVESNFAADALFPGGTINQVLTKKSNTDGDTEWRDPTEVNVVVNTREETQTLAALQVVVDLTTTTTTGLAVYIDGIRLARAGYTVNSATQLTLSNAYPAGTQITLVQNEPSAQIQSVPIGQIVMLGLSASPAQLFGYGTWTQVGKGRAIFGLDDADADFNTLAKTGGSKVHSHSGTTETAGAHNHGAAVLSGGEHNHGSATGAAGAHSHGNTTGSAGAHSHGSSTSTAGAHNHSGVTGGTAITIAQMPNHNHGMVAGVTAAGFITGTVDGNANSSGLIYTGSNGDNQPHDHSIPDEPGHSHVIAPESAHNHAISAELAHAHTISGSGTHTHGVSSDGTHSHNLSTQQSGNLPPYFTVALWQRTA